MAEHPSPTAPSEGRGVLGTAATAPILVARVAAKLDRGGAQLSLLRVARSLAARGIVTRLLAAHASPAGLDLALEHGLVPEVYGLAGDLQWTPDEGFAAWLRPRLAGADAVHAHMFGAWWAAARAVAAGQPLIASEHNALRWPGPDRGLDLRHGLRRVDRFFAHGPGARATVLSAGLPGGRLRDGISPVAGMGTPSRADPDRPGPIVFAGRHDHDKGPDVFLDAVARLRTRRPVLMLGAGRMDAELRRQRARLGLEDRVAMPGWQPDPAPAIASASVLVVPSRDESFSQTAVLAMGLGVPVIGTRVDGFPLTLGEGRGILVAPEDPAALAAAVDGVLDGDLQVDLAAAHRFAQRFDPERVADVYEQTYRAMTVPSSGRVPQGA